VLGNLFLSRRRSLLLFKANVYKSSLLRIYQLKKKKFSNQKTISYYRFHPLQATEYHFHI